MSARDFSTEQKRDSQEVVGRVAARAATPVADASDKTFRDANKPMPLGDGAAVKTTCPYCGVGCGIITRLNIAGEWETSGDPSHPANFGRTCSKGSALSETLSLEDRLLYPEISGKRVAWDQALGTIAKKFEEISRSHGPDAIAFYLSGQMLTEDYYIANKLAKGFIGTRHVDTNSRLCMASSVAGHKRAFGSDTVPGCYEDLDLADLIILSGSNAAWCHPVLFQRMQENRRMRGAKIITIDVRQTATSQEADLALTIRPGTDAFLFNGLFVRLLEADAIDRRFLEEHCTGFDETAEAAKKSAPNAQSVANHCGLSTEEVEEFWSLFLRNEKTVTCYSQGINQSSSGTDKVNAILNCHLASARIGKAGCGPFSLTGQPNAMGGREVGGLANQLAAHMGFDAPSIDIVRRFWNAPHMAEREGKKAVDMFDALHNGEIKAVWIMCTNPAVSLPQSKKISEALARAEFVVVSECMAKTDSLDFAHVKLPAATWGEKDGTVTNSERRISRQRAFLSLPGDAKPDWWALTEVARRMGFEKDFSYERPADIFREHAQLSAFENNGTRDFDLSGLANISHEKFDKLAPVSWPVTQDGDMRARLFADGQFFGKDNKGTLVPVEPRGLAQSICPSYPIMLNTGRVRDQWHTMTRTGKSARLSRHVSEPFIELSLRDAADISVIHGGLAIVRSKNGKALLRVHVTDNQPAGRAFSPIHWSGQNSACGRISNLVSGHCDPISGQPESKSTPITIARANISHSGILVSKVPLIIDDVFYWSRWKLEHCYVHAVGFDDMQFRSLPSWFEAHFPAAGQIRSEFFDSANGDYRCAHFENEQLSAMLAVRAGQAQISEETLNSFFACSSDNRQLRRSLLSLTSLNGLEDRGPIVCACFSVGVGEILNAIEEGGEVTVEDIGRLLKAGTNCGSCLPEIRQLCATS